MNKILIVEDEEAIRDMIQFSLKQSGYIVYEAKNVSEAWNQIAYLMPDLIILDWMLPDKSGIEFLKEIKIAKQTQNIYVIMLTARAEEESKVKGLEIGADDYITKPFSPLELVSRIKTVLRRGKVIAVNDVIELGPFSLNQRQRIFKIKNQIIHLTKIEFNLIQFLMKNPGVVYDREHLLLHVWPGEKDISDRAVDVVIRRLRSKFKPYHMNHYLKTIHGTG
ncbi:MAG: response regulator, partial [Gammaproteobacteria bacterium]|nr:response regulator [Gammaproteobacteria bacterium]